MKKLKYFHLSLFAFFSLVGNANEYIVRPKAYLDVESGKMIFNKVIKIRNQKIVSILNDNATLKNVISLKDIYLIPGLIDSHTHIFFSEYVKDGGFSGALIREARLEDKYRTSRAKIFLRQYLKEGFTSIYDLGNSGYFLDAALKKELTNRIDYPLLYVSGPGIAAGSGQFVSSGTKALASKEYSLISSRTNIDKLLATYVSKDVDILKIYLDNSPEEGGIDSETLKKILSNSKIKKFKKVTFHTAELKSFEMAMKMKLKHLEHSNQIVMSNEAYRFLKYITPTDLDSETLKEFGYFNNFFYLSQKKRFKYLATKNVKLIFGSDFYFNKDDVGFDRAKYVKKSIKYYIEAGVSNIEIIKALTIYPAKSLGEESKIGLIKEGGYANLIGFKKNPLVQVEALFDKPLVINRGKINFQESN